jgi:hypothetical protein
MIKKLVNIFISINLFIIFVNKLSEIAYKILSLQRYIEFKKSNSFKKVRNYIKKPIVVSGPFKGLNYEGISSYCSTIYPKLMGTYEAELHQIINNIIKKKYQRIIDIGSAEGYYAVGIPFAMKDESIEVVAVEISEVAKKNLKRLIKNNIKNKVQITDNFDFQKYQDDKKTLVIMDCEGSEMDYLKKFSKKSIAKWDFLIEAHVQIKRNIIREIEKILKGKKIIKIKSVDDYHKIEEYSYNLPKNFDDNTKLVLLSENRRTGMYWLSAN